MLSSNEHNVRSPVQSKWNVFRHFSAEDERKYQKFLEKESSVTIHVIIFVAAIINTVMTIMQAASLPLPHSLFLHQRVLVLPSLGLYTYQSLSKHFTILKPLQICDTFIGDAVILSYTITYGVYLYGFTFSSGCSTPYKDLFFCEKRFPAGPALIYAMICTGTPIIYKCRHLSIALSNIVIEIIFVVMIVVKLGYDPNFTRALIALILCQVAILLDLELYSRQVYLAYINLDTTIRSKLEADNDKALMELQSTELRYLIGNVAHDLKTPLHAFTNELETIRKVIVFKPRGSDGSSSNAGSSSMDRQIEKQVQESVDILSGVCSFMVMTINRAIDYTKASSGIKLTPSMETVSLSASLQWTATCMSRASPNSDSTPVVIALLPPECCDCIITDKQWLLENLLCLVSNAQKYSSQGAISIQCSLEPALETKVRMRAKSRKIFPSQLTAATEISYDGEQSTLYNTYVNSGQEPLSHIANAGYVHCASDSTAAPGIGNTYDTAGKYVSSPRLDETEYMLVLAVEDEGIGIPVDMRGSLFQPFKQTMRRAGGTGLGLYSLYKRVEILGGCCGIADRSDGRPIGSRIWFSIPYKPDYTNHARTSCPHMGGDDAGRIRNCAYGLVHSSDGLPTSSVAGGTRFRAEDLSRATNPGLSPITSVLLVDDSKFIQKTTARILEKVGVDVDIASNGVECLQKMETRCYGLVLMDIQMPIMDGLEATRRLRAREEELRFDQPRLIGDVEAGAELPPRSLVIGLSANSDSESRQEALDVGMDYFIPKPLHISELQTCLQQLGFDLHVVNSHITECSEF